jgi:hypothetical protein
MKDEKFFFPWLGKSICGKKCENLQGVNFTNILRTAKNSAKLMKK